MVASGGVVEGEGDAQMLLLSLVVVERDRCVEVVLSLVAMVERD